MEKLNHQAEEQAGGCMQTLPETDDDSLQKKEVLLRIPQQFDTYRLPADLSMQTMLHRLETVTQGAAISNIRGNTLFSSEEPNTGLEMLFQACVLPPTGVLDEMAKAFGQLWSVGKANSILDWTNHKIRYPLSALSAYRELTCANDTRAEWKRAEHWMKHPKASDEMQAAASMAKRLMFTLEWDAGLRAIETNVSTRNLLFMLNDTWLSDDHIDMLIQTLTDRAEMTNGNAIIAPCMFQHYLQYAFATQKGNQRLVPLLEQYGRQLTKGRKTNLYFVGHVNGNHWVTWKFDYEKAIIGHGDSLGLSELAMEPLKNCLMSWVKTLYKDGRECTYASNMIPHGNQTGDSFSCGVIAYNAIAHELFGDDLWTKESRKQLRIQAFNAIVMKHNEHRIMKTSVETASNQAAPAAESKGQGLQVPCQETASPSEATVPSSCSMLAENDSETSNTKNADDKVSSALSLKKESGIHTAEEYKSSGITANDMIVDNTSTRLVAVPSQFDVITGDASVGAPAILPGRTCSAEGVSFEPGCGHAAKDLMGTNKANPTAMILSATKRPQKKLKDNKGGPLDIFLRPTTGSLAEARRCELVHEGQKQRVAVRGCNERRVFVGQSRSAQASKKARAAQLSGTYKINNSYLATLKTEVLSIDQDAAFDPPGWRIQHSRCQKWIKLKSAYSPRYFEEHVQRCKATSSLHDFAFLSTRDRPSQTPSMKAKCYSLWACGGISAEHNPRIQNYLHRPTALGGGGRSKNVLAREKFGKAYGDLTKQQKEHTRKLNESEWRWVIKHQNHAVYSASCLKTVQVLVQDSSGELSTHTCSQCLALLQNSRFRKAISVPEPLVQNTIFANKEYHQEEIAIKFAKCRGIAELIHPNNNETSLAVRYAVGVASGKFQEDSVFVGLVNTIVKKMERTEKGKKTTNFKYPEAFDEFISTVFLISPRAHQLLSKYFQVRSGRSIRTVLAKEPQFSPGISEQSFERADEFVSALNVPHRHVAVSADDTKLLATFRPFLDRKTHEWYIVGCTGDPLRVADLDSLRAQLESADLVKATKVRVWVIMVPFPSIPPLVLAAIAITEDTTAATLNEYTNQVLDGLRAKRIWLISYACDGTEKERSNQKLVQVQAHSTDVRTIRSPSAEMKDLKVHIALFGGLPTALVQDSSHGRKTFRNNIQSGTKMLVLGNFSVLYLHLRDMAFDRNSPLYRRDVEKTDKQDDRAAERVFSSAALAWLIHNRPDNTGTIIFLFIFGELVDAYQNRSISHFERLQMVLRAHYFVEIWKLFLLEANYPLKKTCLSREALDITSFLVNGYLQLFFIYRDYFDGICVPFVPWLHSSEACEHVFGECRKHVKDFDFASFCHLMPKIHWMLRSIMKGGSMSNEEAKARASGYAHTWFDMEGLSLNNLATFPPDKDIEKIARIAFNEADELWQRLGICLSDLRDLEAAPDELAMDSDDSMDEMEMKQDKSNGKLYKRKLPSISDWYPDLKAILNDSREADDDSPMQCIAESAQTILEDLIWKEQDDYENGPMRLDTVDKTMLHVSSAKLFLDFDTSMHVEELAIPTKDQYAAFLEEYREAVGNYMANTLPSIVELGKGVQLYSESLRSTLSTKKLLETRRAHETELARKAIRTSTSGDEPEEEQKPKDNSKVHYALIKKISEALRLQQDHAIGTGLERRARWNGTEKTGNAANAALAATARSAKVLSQRCAVYSTYHLPQTVTDRLSTAGISDTSPLHNGAFGIVFVKQKLLLAQVLSIYMKGGGEHGKHAWVERVTQIGQISYISLQTFEQARGRVFREVQSALTHLRVRSFAHIPPFEFLCLLPAHPFVRHDRHSIELPDTSFAIWKAIHPLSGIFAAIMKDFRKREK